MSTLTIRLPDAKHQRLKAFARSRGISVNKLVQEWATVALVQLDAEDRCRLRARRGRVEQGLAPLDKLDRAQEAAQSPRRARAAASPKAGTDQGHS